MNAEKENKIFHKIILIFVAIIIISTTLFYLLYGELKQNKKIEFLQQYYDSYDSAKEEIESCKYFKLDWLKMSAITMIESGGHKTARSSVARGYKQLHINYIDDIRGYVHKIAEINRSCSMWDTRFQMWGGNFLMRDILDNMTSGTDRNSRFNRALLIYNMGYGGLLRAHSRQVNYAYVRKWGRWYTKLKYEWNKFKPWWMII